MRIINKQRAAHIVYENEKSAVFLDRDPIHEGHVLIVPKVHVDSVDKIPEDRFEYSAAVAEKIEKAMAFKKNIKSQTGIFRFTMGRKSDNL